MSKLEVLAVTVNGDFKNLVEKMNIRSDAVIANQCDGFGYDCFEHNGSEIRCFSFAERGVGLNRNNALMRAKAEISLIADDDMRYCDDYAEKLEEQFEKYPQADVLIFNVTESRGRPFVIRKPMKIGYLNYMRFATFRFAFRTESVRKHGISFNLSFGGGTRYSHGEDSLFLRDCLREGLKVIAVPVTIAELLYDRNSSWFRGFDDKYFYDQGVLYAAISRKLRFFLCLQDAIRHQKKYASHGGIMKNYRAMLKGAKEFLS